MFVIGCKVTILSPNQTYIYYGKKYRKYGNTL